MLITDVSLPSGQAHANDSEALQNKELLEEESFPWYTEESFYPVRIGEVFKSRYQVIGKLGYGSVSTAWLCRDLETHQYVALKVYISDHRQSRNEVKVFTHLKSVKTSHPGSELIRTVLDTFEVVKENSSHQCLVHKPLGLTLKELRMLSSGRLPGEMLKAIVNYLLLALDYLHTEARVVHTDIQEGNLMMALTDDSTLEHFEKEESVEPSRCKTMGDRVIYESRALEIPDEPGYPVLCDFGDAQFGEKEYLGEVMPDLYRAPEIVLGIPWNEKIDIWAVGLMVWDCFEGKHMFNEQLPSREKSTAAHLARMIALFGPPPIRLLQRGFRTGEFFDKDGKFTPDLTIPTTSLEYEEENLQGDEKAAFLRFLSKMLRWLPEERESAKELMKDPWLQMG